MTKLRKSLYDGQSAGVLYSGAILLTLLISFIFAFVLRAIDFSLPEGETFPDWYLYFSFLLPQLAFALAVTLFFVFTEAKPKEVYQGAKWQYFLLAIVLQFGLFSLSWVNGLFLQFLQDSVGYESSMQIPSLEGGGIVWVILVVALLPAIFEESIFRGLLLHPLKKLSTPVAVVLCGALFALYHQNPAQTLYQFCCGCAFALVAIRANSVLPTVISHFLNNAFILVLSSFGVNDFSGVGGAIFYVVSAVALVGSLVYLIFIDQSGNAKKTESVTPFLLTASVGIAVCVITWLSNLMLGVA